MMNLDLTGNTINEQNNPLVSIGMTVYNGQRFVAEAIESLLNQTYTNFKLIISDDASSDSSFEICKLYSEKDERIKVIKQSKNIGPHHNFKFVLDQSEGEYFMWAAADDLWRSDFIEKCVDSLESDPATGFAFPRFLVTSMLTPLLNRRWIADLDCIELNNPAARVLAFTQLPFLKSFKDNMAYALWRRNVIKTITDDIRQVSDFGPLTTGAAMNEYALARCKGQFIREVLFYKRYRLVPPGHILAGAFNIVSLVKRKISNRVKSARPSYSSADYIKDLTAVLGLAGFDEKFISRAINANLHHMKFNKVQKDKLS